VGPAGPRPADISSGMPERWRAAPGGPGRSGGRRSRGSAPARRLCRSAWEGSGRAFSNVLIDRLTPGFRLYLLFWNYLF